MNSSYNYADFIGLSLESNDDYEPYGYDMEALQTIDTAQANGADRSIEPVILARGISRRFID